MSGLTAAQLLDLADLGRDAGQVERGLLLLGQARPDSAVSALAALPVGERDRLLIELRRDTFGPAAPARTTCPDCRAELLAALHLPDMSAASSPDQGHHTMTWGGRTVIFRMPTSADLLSVAGDGDRDRAGAKSALLAACVETIDGTPATSTPPDLATAVVAAMAAVDPLLDVELTLRCGACGHTWSETFDIVEFFWAEIWARAGRLFAEIHGLAGAYGWSEEAILALSPRRRERYLALVAS